MPGIQKDYGYQYETVAASQTGQVLGGTGAVGDYLHRLVISVVTVATGAVTIIDGATSIVVLTGAATLVPGVYSVDCGFVSASGAWSITTGAGATVIAVGTFSA